MNVNDGTITSPEVTPKPNKVECRAEVPKLKTAVFLTSKYLERVFSNSLISGPSA